METHPTELVGQLAHELRQPLSAMEAIAYYLQLTVADDPRTRAQVEKLQQLIEHTGRILTGAVHYVQAAPLRMELRHLEDILESAIAGLAADEQSSILVCASDDLPPVQLDPSQAEYLLSTALVFCLQATSSPVHVRCHLEADMVRTAFIIPAEALAGRPVETFFIPFGNLPALTAGLGLASVRRIAEAHGGSCLLIPDRSGFSELEIRLPVAGSHPHN